MLSFVIAVALIWLAVARWNGVPADPNAAPLDQMPTRIPLDPALDRSAELVAAFQAIPAEPTWTLPPAPPGMRWARSPGGPIDPGEALDGEWTPETRPHLQAVINHLRSQPVQSVIEQLARIEPGGCRIVLVPSSIRRVTKLLVARARYQQAARQDVDAAIDDLLTVLRLSATCYNSANHLMLLTAVGCEGLAEGQLQCLAFEARLTRVQAKRIIAAIQSTFPDDHALWRTYVEMELDTLNRALDSTYSMDGDGRGWLVLSRLDCLFGEPLPSKEARLGVWNVLSPLFNDRPTITAKIDRARRALEGLERLPFKDGWERTGAIEANLPFNLLDGPLSQATLLHFAQPNYKFAVMQTTYRRAAIVAAALSAYRADHGAYPASLPDLLSGYLDAVPLDPYDDHPIRYIPKPEDDDFLLYCVWLNQIDDGGNPSTPSGSGDLIIRHKPRADLYSEVKLEKIEP